MSKKIVFIALYDYACIGTRLLAAIAESCGVETRLILFKEHRSRPVREAVENPQLYQIYHDGVRHATLHAAYPYTRREVDLLIETLRHEAPDAICLSTRSFGYPYCKEIFSRVRADIDAPIIGGGWGPTLEPEKFLEFCDFVCFGEGERAMEGICEHLVADSRDFGDVPNLIYRVDDQLRHNPVAEPLSQTDLDELPLRDTSRDHALTIEDNRISSELDGPDSSIHTCLATRGCPMKCTYCLSGRYTALYRESGHTVHRCRVRNAEGVLEELRIAKRNGARYIRFKDEVFPWKQPWLETFLPAYRREIGLPFFAYLRPELHSPEVMERAVRAGLTSTVIGIQSGCERTRKEIYQRTLSEEDLVEFAWSLRRLRVDFKYHLIHHNPFESEGDLSETLELMQRLPFERLAVVRLVTFPGAPITAMIEERKPIGLPAAVHEWYAKLWTLAATGPKQRSLARWVHQRRLFRDHQAPLEWALAPARAKLRWQRWRNKRLFGQANLLSMPTRDSSLDPAEA